ncbi:hypothetical protein FRC09_012773, partial [Ceratobasidium sp. 395]
MSSTPDTLRIPISYAKASVVINQAPRILAEAPLTMAGHGSSLLHPNGSVALESTPLLYPEEQQTLKELAKPACQYRNPKCSSAILGRQSQYMSSLRATLRENLMGYEERVVDTEPPTSTIWEVQFTLLLQLVDQLEAGAPPPHNSDPPRAWANANRLAPGVKQVGWIHLLTYLVHGVLEPMDPLAGVEDRYKPNPGVRHRLRMRVERSQWWVAFSLDRCLFDEAAERIKANVSECFGNYFLLWNGEFALALLRETERLTTSRLSAKPTAHTPSEPTRGTDLSLAIFRSSLDTTAQNDSSLDNLRFTLVDRPLRAPPFTPVEKQAQVVSRSTVGSGDGSSQVANV